MFVYVVVLRVFRVMNGFLRLVKFWFLENSLLIGEKVKVVIMKVFYKFVVLWVFFMIFFDFFDIRE